MKKIICVIALALSFLSLKNSALATGVFEMNEFSDSYMAIAGEDFKAHFSFYYSGTSYTPKVVTVSSLFPEGISLSPLKTESVSFYSVDYLGIPTVPGDYSVTLMMTDDYGALLVKKFTIKVQGLVFNTTTLPSAIVNREYVQDIYFTYPGTEIPRITFFDFPQSIVTQTLDPNGFNRHVTLRFTPRQVGQFTIKATASMGMLKKAGTVQLGTRTFNITVENEAPALPPAQIIVSPPPTIAPVIIAPTVAPKIVTPPVITPAKPKIVTAKPKTVVTEKVIEQIIATTSPVEVAPITIEQIIPVAEEVKATPVPAPTPKPFWSRVISWLKFW